MEQLFNVTNINISEGEVENFLNKVINYFSSEKLPFACFRISPLTSPRSFTSLLEHTGFERKPEHEQSVMVFQGESLEDKLNPAVEVKEISGAEIDLFDRLLIASFEMPIEWKAVFDKINLEWLRKGAKHYLAYVDGKPVGVTTLISLMKTGGIFSVGTLKEYRRRGVGTTLTVHAVLDSMKIGNNLHTLQTDKGGDAERLYKKIGFEVDHTISYFVKKF